MIYETLFDKPMQVRMLSEGFALTESSIYSMFVACRHPDCAGKMPGSSIRARYVARQHTHLKDLDEAVECSMIKVIVEPGGGGCG